MIRHRLAVAWSVSTLALIFIGGLVTSTHSGLSVPDWPLSYGRLMPPMVGGILFEHGHRLVAAGVGLLTIAIVAAFGREPRRWLRRATWIALGMVILQGVLGGLTVLMKLPKPVSIAHGMMAQTFFCLSVAIAVWSSPRWEKMVSSPVKETDIPLPHIALVLFLGLYLQLGLGAVVRHTGRGVEFHMVNAVLILGGIGWLFHRLTSDHVQDGALWKVALGLGLLFAAQVSLGLITLLMMTVSSWSLHPAESVAAATGHVMAGAALLGLSVILLLLCWRRFPGSFSSERIKDYVSLTKPGISLMAALTALAGYCWGAGGVVHWGTLAKTAGGTLLVSAGACALNMLFERDVDARMHRTRTRPLPARRLWPGEALFLGVVLLVGGTVHLAVFVNSLTALIAGITAGVYLYIYTPMKKVSALNTVFGAAAGALPPVMGWTAATGRLGVEAAVLFFMLFFWQFPHFFSLAWLYREDYARAGLSMLPASEGDGSRLARRMVVTAVALSAASLMPLVLGRAGEFYGAAALGLGAAMIGLGVLFLRERSALRARRVFLASVFYLPLLLSLLVLDGIGSGQ